MKSSLKHKPVVLYRNGKPSKVLLDIDVYKAILERLDDQDDLEYLRKLKEQGETFRPLEEFIADYK